MSATEANRQQQSPQASAGWPSAPLRLRAASLIEIGAAVPEQALCVVGYGETAMANDPRCVSVPLRLLHGDHAGEIWDSATPVRHGLEDGIRFAENGEVLMLQLALPEDVQSDPEAAAEQLYARLQAFTAAHGYPHLLRVWNYLARINQGEGDAERYRQFCVGRYRALAAQQSDFEIHLPAASAIGSRRGGLHVHAFATRVLGLQVENPRQVSAFRYPRSYGSRSPSFSRATLVPWADGAQLLVSGTASIIGHATAHAGDVIAQLGQTHANLELLRSHAASTLLKGTDAQALRPELYTVYLRHEDDLPKVLPMLAERFGDAPCKVLAGDICRRELLIEVEASYRLDATGNP
jgi:chorismate lyase/3-hydroxybenzoate synthase